ncbi:hypothetical protein EOI86_09855 [Hwanghaeella grinnelliae]|uniref:VPLPA-CTERM sorting domain-containing protein n=1 Tax=Hwanghaeella grinnelliae TaxID=2500179 RepID=A0A3S2ZAW2_9PROT|nr:hypothetical protein [Hwanghaeella grinnelliae]RVU39510.1 hypothetical protein EOI86_09855 [Hwanghaeella grinnelliae]
MRRHLMSIAAAIAMIAGAGAGPAAATVLGFTPTADGDVQLFGGTSIDTTDTVLSFTQSGGLERRIFLEFDLSAIPDAAVINSVNLTMTLTSPIIGPFLPAVYDVFAYNGDGTIDAADFTASKTQVVDSTIDDPENAGLLISRDFSSTLPVLSALAGDLLTLSVETDSFASGNFVSIDSGNTSVFPALTVDFTVSTVPVPAALPLAATALAALGFIGRRRRRS